jgi:hypothetical protein
VIAAPLDDVGSPFHATKDARAQLESKGAMPDSFVWRLIWAARTTTVCQPWRCDEFAAQFSCAITGGVSAHLGRWMSILD